jgi:hypothetical protein
VESDKNDESKPGARDHDRQKQRKSRHAPAPQATEPTKIISIGDFEAVRSEILDIIGPGGYRAAVAKLTGQPVLVPFRIAEPDALTSKNREGKCDLLVRDEGTIVTFTANTDAGESFLWSMLHTEPYQWQGNTLEIDHRMAQEVLSAAENESLCVKFVSPGTR